MEQREGSEEHGVCRSGGNHLAHTGEVRAHRTGHLGQAEEFEIGRHLLHQHFETGMGLDAARGAGAHQRRRGRLHQDVEDLRARRDARDIEGERFWLSPRVLRLGQSYLESARLPRLVQPFIQRLSMQCGETANVSVLDGHEVVYVARSNSPRVVSIGFLAGARVPAHVVAPGPVLLAQQSEEALAAWLDRHEFAAFTASTPVDRAGFAEQVRLARRRGCGISVGQLDGGLSGVAVPLKDRRGECRAALGMTLQTTAWSEARIVEVLLPPLLETAATLRALL